MTPLENTKAMLLDFKGNRNYIAFSKMAIQNKEHLKNMLELCLTVKYPFPQYSSWLLSHVGENHLNELLPYHHQIIDVFLNCTEFSTQRNLANTILKLPETNYRDGEMLEYLFQFLLNSETKVALKAYAMYLLIPLVKPYPELIRELKLVLDARLEFESKAFSGAVKKVVRMLDK